MKAFVVAIGVAALITVGAWYGLTQAGFSAADRYQVPENVRLGQ